MPEEDLKKIEDYSYTMSTISSATEQDTGIGNLIYKLVQAYKNQQTELEKKDQIIDETVKVIIDSSICDYFIKQNCKHYAGENKKTCDDCIKQYFERKVNSNE